MELKFKVSVGPGWMVESCVLVSVCVQVFWVAPLGMMSMCVSTMRHIFVRKAIKSLYKVN